MDLLAPLLNVVVTLDPHHIPAYRFGAIFLPERDLPAAIALLEKGIQENPNEWRLYQDIGYINWQAGNSARGDEHAAYYAKAAEWYDKGGKVPGAMWWMRDLAGYMKIAGGSREAAYAIYSTYLNSDDENIRKQAALRMKQLRALGEMDAINELLARYKAQTGQCPTDLRQLAPQLRAMKLTLNDEQQPVDPDGIAYELKIENCKVELAWSSQIPR
jgi:tetratricopeptide (TPR) repeat protein